MIDTPSGHFVLRRHAAFHEAGPDLCLRLDALADWLQDVGGQHADSLGLGADVILARGLTWALRRLTVHVAAMPAVGGEVVVETWPSGRDKLLFDRDFRVVDVDGQVLVVACSRWSVVDVERRRAVAIPDWMADRATVDSRRAGTFATAAVSALGDAAVSLSRPVLPRWSDLDLNGHVNNARLVGWLVEALPRAVPEARKLVELDVSFRVECRLGDAVASRAVDLGGGGFRHALANTETDRDIVRAETRWISV